MHWMHHDAQKLRTVGFPLSEASLSVADPLKPWKVQLGSCFPGDVRLCGVHAGKRDAVGLLVHEMETARSGIAMSRSARTDRLCRNRARSAERGQRLSPVATVAAG